MNDIFNFFNNDDYLVNNISIKAKTRRMHNLLTIEFFLKGMCKKGFYTCFVDKNGYLKEQCYFFNEQQLSIKDLSKKISFSEEFQPMADILFELITLEIGL